MKSIQLKLPSKKAQSSFIIHEIVKQFPIAYNVSETHYCGFKLKKKFFQRYLNYKHHQESGEHNPTQKLNKAYQIDQNMKYFKIFPIKVLQNSPQLLRGRMKTYIPRGKICQQRNKSNRYEKVGRQFLQIKSTRATKKDRTIYEGINEKTKQFDIKRMRPATANHPFPFYNQKLRRTKTLSVANSAIKQQSQFKIKGWENEMCQYD